MMVAYDSAVLRQQREGSVRLEQRSIAVVGVIVIIMSLWAHHHQQQQHIVVVVAVVPTI